MKIAIVGTSLVYENEIFQVQQLCYEILKKYKPLETTVISGGAKGVDTIALNMALSNGFAIKEILPLGYTWGFFKKRNLEIVEQCDELFCISTPVHFIKCFHHTTWQDHEKTAGCWTMNKAIEANKPTKFLMTEGLKIQQHEPNH